MPIVILMDDVDKTLRLINDGNIPQSHRDFNRYVYSKATMNSMLDDLKDKPNVRILLTMNSTPPHKNVDITDPNYLAICPSMLRSGRVQRIYELLPGGEILTHEPLSASSN